MTTTSMTIHLTRHFQNDEALPVSGSAVVRSHEYSRGPYVAVQLHLNDADVNLFVNHKEEALALIAALAEITSVLRAFAQSDKSVEVAA